MACRLALPRVFFFFPCVSFPIHRNTRFLFGFRPEPCWNTSTLQGIIFMRFQVDATWIYGLTISNLPPRVEYTAIVLSYFNNLYVCFCLSQGARHIAKCGSSFMAPAAKSTGAGTRCCPLYPVFDYIHIISCPLLAESCHGRSWLSFFLNSDA
jgi:hypothetical protein